MRLVNEDTNQTEVHRIWTEYDNATFLPFTFLVENVCTSLKKCGVGLGL